ncbi:hypothetical protein EDC04DRAFT_2612668 [Pisolithus marmoratus]|nr:hypothetical protein EDC04DRAFT_2612668 [Pisolithus marmoratus]
MISTTGFAYWVDKLAFNAAILNKYLQCALFIGLTNCKWKVQSEEVLDHHSPSLPHLLYSILISSLSGHKVLSHELGTSNSINVYYLFFRWFTFFVPLHNLLYPYFASKVHSSN